MTLEKQLTIAILDRFETYLYENGVHINNPERDEYEQENQMDAAIIFGSDYGVLEEDIIAILKGNVKE